MLKRVFLFLSFALSLSYSFGQTLDTSNTDRIDDLSDKLFVKIFGSVKSNVIRHYDIATQTAIDYKPNENFNIGIGAGHKWLAFDLGINFGIINNDNAIYGQTKRFDLQSNIYMKKFVIDLHYQRYKGYYASKPWNYLEGYNIGDLNFPIRPDIKTSNTSIDLFYVFNPDRFSYKAAFIYNQKQNKSGGSFLGGAYFSIYQMDADSTIVPLDALVDFNPTIDYRGNNFISYGLTGGYGHTFTMGKNFYFSLSFTIGFGNSSIKTPSTISSVIKRENDLSVRGGLRSSLGFNSEKSLFGISVVTLNATEAGDNKMAQLTRGVSSVKLFYGRRFTTPKSLKKIFK